MPSPVDRRKQGLKSSVLVEGRGIPRQEAGLASSTEPLD
jgi:hypothetical protein